MHELAAVRQTCLDLVELAHLMVTLIESASRFIEVMSLSPEDYSRHLVGAADVVTVLMIPACLAL